MDYQKTFEIVTDKYSDKLLRWSIRKTGNRLDGEDLAQEVLLQVFISIAKGNRISKMENYLWKVAHFVWCNYLRRLTKTNKMILLDETIQDEHCFIDDFVDRDFFQSEVARMRRKIADLSSVQREAMILHYLEGLSVRQVAEKFGITESAVKKHLFSARNKLKKELGEMKAVTSYVYQPGRLVLGVSGLLGPDPDTVKVNDNLVRQNILLLCYETPKTINDLAELTGIPKPYLEHELEWLTNREFLSLEGKEYATIIPIIGKKHRQDIGELYNSTRQDYIDVIISYLWDKEAEIRKIGFYGANFEIEKLMWSVIMMFLSYFSRNSEIATRLKKRDNREIRPDGGKYYVIGNDLSDNQDINPDGYFKPEGWNDFYGICSGSCTTEGEYDSYYWLGVYSFTAEEYHPDIINEDNKYIQRVWHNLYCALIEPDFSTGHLSEDEKEMLTIEIQKGFVTKEKGLYKPNFIIMSPEQLKQLQEDIFAPLLIKITPKCEELAQFISGLHAKRMPKVNKGYIDFLTYLDLWYFGIYTFISAAQDKRLYIPETPEEGALLTLVLVKWFA